MSQLSGHHFFSSKGLNVKSFQRLRTALLTLFFIGLFVDARAADLRVMKTGLGDGSISGAGITCGTDCNESFPASASVTLNVTVTPGSRFTAWGGDCASVVVTPPATPPCMVAMNAVRSVRANFDLVTPVPALTHAELTPAGIQAYLDPTGPGSNVNTPAEFVAALPQDFRENWILMMRSESLQTGTAKLPRIMLVSADATKVFTLGLAEPNDSYPGAHANAIEYMQWDLSKENFRFHEIILDTVPALGDVIDEGPPVVRRFEARSRGVTEDDAKCFACHSTRNVKHTGGTPGTTGIPPGSVKFKSKPNWDTYDSWGGMMPFNRDRIYKGTVEAAAFRKFFNLWTWQNNDAVRMVLEQLKLQPDGVPDGSGALPDHRITRWDTPGLEGGENDGHIQFGFDPDPPAVVTDEPQPTGAGVNISYSFDRRAGTSGSTVLRDNEFVTLHHSCQPTNDEGRGVELFDLLTAGIGPVSASIAGTPSCPRPATPPPDKVRPNPLRVADELSSHTHATGSIPIDIKPVALAIAESCITVSGGTDINSTQTVSGVSPISTLDFFTTRNGLNFDEIYDDTRRRAQSLTRRKADIQRTTLDRDADIYVYDPAPFDGMPIMPPFRVDGLIREYGDGTLGISGGTGGQDLSIERLRQEVFRRPPSPGHPDETVMGRVYADREDDSSDPPPFGLRPDNTGPVALFRYFLEPLGVSVDKWSMGVRGRSRTYTFADIWSNYPTVISAELKTSLGLPATAGCSTIMPLASAVLAALPPVDGIPTYTDIQRILNKSCIECHGGLGYPPAQTYGVALDFSEDENPPAGERRLWKSLRSLRSLTSVPMCAPGTPVCSLGTATDVANSDIIQRITDNGMLEHPYNPAEPYDISNPDSLVDPDVADERCPRGLMPCEGPPLSKVDIETIGRWIIGGRPNTEGDPHIRTVEGVRYDFQSAGEFVLLRDESMELQARHTAVTTAGPLGPNAYTGLSSCVSVNTAVAMRVGGHRVTYQPEILPASNDEFSNERRIRKEPSRLILRVDGKPVALGNTEITLPQGGRIVRTGAKEGIEVHYPGGTSVVVTPGWWSRHQIWYMNINVNYARAVNGIMGVIAPDSWLPALSDGTWLGARPASLAQRHQDLYETFADSWRVDNATSLFDYESGLSPQSFVVEGWPVAQAQGCVAPPQPGGPVTSPPAPTPIAQTEAEQLCSAITDSDRRANCVVDIMATGERGFADTYLMTQELEQRPVPRPPVLDSPANNSVQTSQGLDFSWSVAPGSEDIDVRYRHCIWNGDELYDFNRCVKLGQSGNPVVDLLPTGITKHLTPGLCLIVIVILLIIAILLFIRSRYRAAIIVLILALILALVCYLIDRDGGSAPLATHVSELEPGKVYFWKVTAETEQGIVIESKTRRFEVEN